MKRFLSLLAALVCLAHSNALAIVVVTAGDDGVVFKPQPLGLGVATVTSVNGLTVTASTGTLTIPDTASLITSGAYSLTLTATATTAVTLPTSGTLYGTATGSITSAQLLASLTNETGTGVAVFGTTPTLTTPVIGVATGTSLSVSGLLTSSSPSAKIGYATGAGLTATQATDKSTTTTNAASAPSTCGTITTNNATLNAGVIVSFTFTNSAIAATDVMILNHVSGGTVGSYALNAQCGAGSAVINIRNSTAGNLGEALVIQYAVIKAVAN